MSKVKTSPQAIEEVMSRGVQEVVVEKNLRKKLASGKQLRIKHGVDPTSKDLHLGYAVVYEKLRQLQELGHKIVFLIGSFTGRFGDPTDKDKTRDLRTKEEVMAMGKNYVKQLSKILDIDKVEIRYNSQWYDKFSGEEMLRLMSKFTVARMLERDMFQKRMKEGKEIYYHEPVYAMLQGYDSVMLKADATVIGLDQKFNELQARPLQEEVGQIPQDLIMMPLLIGTDGKMKMSQSLGNYIGITEKPKEQYGKVMSIPDTLIYSYFELCTRVGKEELFEIESALHKGQNPRDLKARLAKEIVTIYHGTKAASKAAEEFDRVFKQGKKPDNIPEYKIKKKQELIDVLVDAKAVKNRSEVRRLVKQGAVRLNDELIGAWENIPLKKGDILKIGKKRFLKIK